MLIYIVIAIVVIVALFLVFVATRPSEFTITRSATMSASPTAVHAEVNDFHRWEAWSPWAKMDPNAKNAFAGEASGVGAVFSWDGNSSVGAGRMTILESRPGEMIKIKLEFFKPFKGTNTADFTFKAEGDKTVMTWTMTGCSNFMSKIFCVFMDMDKMVGVQFEKGMASIKAIVEGGK